MASISVVIATYNRPEYLKEAIESVIKQTYPIEQIVVIDDFSPIDSQRVIDMFPNENILYYRKDRNMGVSNSRNIGIQKSTGDYIAILDDDDLYADNKIEVQMKHIRSIDGCIASLTACSILGNRSKDEYMETGIITFRRHF